MMVCFGPHPIHSQWICVSFPTQSEINYFSRDYVVVFFFPGAQTMHGFSEPVVQCFLPQTITGSFGPISVGSFGRTKRG